MRLADLSYKELLDLMLDITNELAERFQKDPESHHRADEFVHIKDIELDVGSLRSSLERSGKIGG